MGRKKKSQMPVQAKQKATVDTNEAVIDPSQPGRSRENALADNVPDLPAMPSKKRRRLEKYIDAKLKKEERIKMLKRLAVTSYTSDLIRSTKSRNNRITRAQMLEINKRQEQMGIPRSFPDVPEPAAGGDTSSDEYEPANGADSWEDLDFFSRDSSDRDERPAEIEETKELATAQEVDQTVQRYAASEGVQPFFVVPNRKAEIQEFRTKLPVFGREQEIVDLINRNPVVVLCSETGSGKTTQVPQFLYEYGYANKSGPVPGMIGITQPRRVAAITMSKRVAEELSLSHSVVSYQIRSENTVSGDTAIKFLTDGVLLREISGDFLLSRYSVVIVDEAHERNLNTDLLVGLLSRICRLRGEMSRNGERFPATNSPVYPLRVVVMSATLRMGDFCNNPALFSPQPPVVNVEGKLFRVNVHFSKATPVDHLQASYRRVCQIHGSLPPGGILVFLTGKAEIRALCNKLIKKYPAEGSLDYSLETDSEDASDGENVELEEQEETAECTTTDPVHVVPLFSMLSPESQLRVFQDPPAGSRLVVVATNVAETSITIPNIKYVVDCGKVKEKIYDTRTQVQRYCLSWISKSSAEQRSGRAGRVCEGHCYRLYSSAVFEREFPQHTLPEIQRLPIDSVLLTMKSMCIDNVANFPFPSPPPRDKLLSSESLLQSLGALDDRKIITDLGRDMSRFPVDPRLSKILVTAITERVGAEKLSLVVLLASCMSVNELFMQDEPWDAGAEPKPQYSEAMEAFGSCDCSSDHLLSVNAYLLWVSSQKSDLFCSSHLVRPKALREIDSLVGQVSALVAKHFCAFSFVLPTVQLARNCKQLVARLLLLGYLENVALLAGGDRRPFYTRLSPGGDAENHHLLVDPFSVVYRSANRPRLVVYTEIQQTQNGTHRIRGLTAVCPSLLWKK